jgi:hypothetical protein
MCLLIVGFVARCVETGDFMLLFRRSKMFRNDSTTPSHKRVGWSQLRGPVVSNSFIFASLQQYSVLQKLFISLVKMVAFFVANFLAAATCLAPFVVGNAEYLSCNRQITFDSDVMHVKTISGQLSPYGGQKNIRLMRNTTQLQCGRWV